MAAPGLVKRAATYEDLLKVPDHFVAEIVDGELYASPRPTPRHATAATVLGAEINSAFHRGRSGPGGWWILFEPELHFDRDVLVPDIAGWRRHRLAAIPETPAITLAPDWVCEVISRSTEGLDRGRKLAVYAREGVAHAWLVNPEAQTREILRLESGRWTSSQATWATSSSGPNPSKRSNSICLRSGTRGYRPIRRSGRRSGRPSVVEGRRGDAIRYGRAAIAHGTDSRALRITASSDGSS